MKVKRKGVPISAELAAEIDALVGKRNRSAFATEIVAREINRLKRQRALDKAADGKPEPGYPYG